MPDASHVTGRSKKYVKNWIAPSLGRFHLQVTLERVGAYVHAVEAPMEPVIVSVFRMFYTDIRKCVLDSLTA